MWLKLKSLFSKIPFLYRKEEDEHERHWGIGS